MQTTDRKDEFEPIKVCLKCGHALGNHWSQPAGGGCNVPGCACDLSRLVAADLLTGKSWEAEAHRLRSELVAAALAWRLLPTAPGVCRALTLAVDAYSEHIRAY